MVIETKPSQMYAVVIPEGGTQTHEHALWVLVYLFLFLRLIRKKEKGGKSGLVWFQGFCNFTLN